jgi:hypothetical protein
MIRTKQPDRGADLHRVEAHRVHQDMAPQQRRRVRAFLAGLPSASSPAAFSAAVAVASALGTTTK